MDPLNMSLLEDLVSATKTGDTQHMIELLSMGVRPDVANTSSGWSALHAAVLFNPRFLRILLEHCTEPDGSVVAGGTPLSYAVHELGESPDADRRSTLLEAIELLLTAGANPRAGGADQTPLELARLYELPDVEALLLRGPL